MVKNDSFTDKWRIWYLLWSFSSYSATTSKSEILPGDFHVPLAMSVQLRQNSIGKRHKKNSDFVRIRVQSYLWIYSKVRSLLGWLICPHSLLATFVQNSTTEIGDKLSVFTSEAEKLAGLNSYIAVCTEQQCSKRRETQHLWVVWKKVSF